MIERRKRRARIRRIRAIVKAAVYVVIALLVFLILWFGVRPALRKLSGKAQPEQAETAESETQSTPTPTPNPDGNTAVRKPLAAPQAGNFGWNVSTNGWWYKNEDATQFAGGWQTIDGQKYYFLDTGYLASGWAEIEGEDYFFRKSGVMDPDAQIRRVALTFEDGPTKETGKIVDLLAAGHAKATFFMVGQAAENFPEEAAKAAEQEMQIGSHTYAEDAIFEADAATVTDVMTRADNAISAATGVVPDVMRPVGTGVSDTMRDNLGKPVIFWDVDTMDLDNPDAASICNTVLMGVQDGSIVRMHDTQEATTGAVREMIPALQEAGFKLVTVDELAAAYGYTPENGHAYYQFKPQEATVPEATDSETENAQDAENTETAESTEDGSN